MQQLPQTTPLRQIQTDQNLVLSRLANGPVILLQEDEPAAVLVSTAEWNRLAKRLETLEEEHRDRVEADRVAASFADGGPNGGLYLRARIEEAIKTYRQNLATYGPQQDRRLLTAEEFSQKQGNESDYIRGSELRKILFKANQADNAS